MEVNTMENTTSIYEIYKNMRPEKGHKKTLDFILDVLTMGFSATWDKNQRQTQIKILENKINKWFEIDDSSVFIKTEK